MSHAENRNAPHRRSIEGVVVPPHKPPPLNPTASAPSRDVNVRQPTPIKLDIEHQAVQLVASRESAVAD